MPQEIYILQNACCTFDSWMVIQQKNDWNTVVFFCVLSSDHHALQVQHPVMLFYAVSAKT